MIGDSSLRASLDRHRLHGIEPVVDPISPMPCQLSSASRKARAVRRQCRISVARRGSRRRSDLLWGGARAIAVAGHLLDSVVRDSEIRRARFNFPMPTKMPTNWTDRANFLPVFSMKRENFPKNMESNQWLKLLFLLVFSAWCPWPESNQHSLRNSILSRARLPIPPQGPSDISRQADVAKPAEYSGRALPVNPQLSA